MAGALVPPRHIRLAMLGLLAALLGGAAAMRAAGPVSPADLASRLALAGVPALSIRIDLALLLLGALLVTAGALLALADARGHRARPVAPPLATLIGAGVTVALLPATLRADSVGVLIAVALLTVAGFAIGRVASLVRLPGAVAWLDRHLGPTSPRLVASGRAVALGMALALLPAAALLAIDLRADDLPMLPLDATLRTLLAGVVAVGSVVVALWWPRVASPLGTVAVGLAALAGALAWSLVPDGAERWRAIVMLGVGASGWLHAARDRPPGWVAAWGLAAIASGDATAVPAGGALVALALAAHAGRHGIAIPAVLWRAGWASVAVVGALALAGSLHQEVVLTIFCSASAAARASPLPRS